MNTTTSELRKMVARAIAKQKRYIEASHNNQNPQVVEMVTRAQGKLDALEAVLDTLNGSPCLLRLMGTELVQ